MDSMDFMDKAVIHFLSIKSMLSIGSTGSIDRRRGNP